MSRLPSIPTPLSGGLLPQTVTITNWLGWNSILGTPLLPQSSFITVASGLPAGARLTLQALVADNNGQAPLTVSNAIELQVW